MTLQALEEGTPCTNKAELYIGLVKEAAHKESDFLMCLWGYCLERQAQIYNLTANDQFKLHGTMAHTLTIGEDSHISNVCQFGWYKWCYYHKHTAMFPNNHEVLGCVLCPACREGNKMAQWILKVNGHVVP